MKLSRLLGATALAGSLISIPATAWAQDNPQSPPATPAATETPTDNAPIIVTGSRIASPTATSASPLQIVDDRQIQESGTVNLQTILLENPTFGTPTLSRTNSNFLTSDAGVATINLRNLGDDRTLVLINGHRTVSSIPGSSAVDLNTIPTALIERVDILTEGASSLYGSDAIAGVVNIIYKKDFQGIKLEGQGGVTEHGDGATYQTDMMIGSNFADGRGNVTAYFGYDKEEGIYSADRPGQGTALDQEACYAVANSAGGCANQINSGNNALLFTPYAPFLSSFNPGGTITFGNTTRTVQAGGVLVPVNTNGLVHSDGVPSTVRPCTTGDPCTPSLALATGFNRSAFRTIAVPVERYTTALEAHYDVTDHVTAYMEGNFAKSTATSLIEPFPFQTSGVNGVAPNACLAGVAQKVCGGWIPIQSVVNGVVVNNPFVPAAILAGATDMTGDGLKDISFTRRLADFGPRTYTSDRQTFRMLAGIKGDIGPSWKWDAYYSFGQTVEAQTGTGQVNLNSFLSALEVIPGPNGPICANPVARAQGCQPANVFGGPGSISPAAVNYIQATQTLDNKVSQNLAGVGVTGDLFTLPWASEAVGLAVGGEYRKESASSTPDPLTVAGLNGGNAQAPTSGSFDVKEAYAELRVPIVSDKPFFKSLTITGAARVSDYSLSAVNTVWSYNYGAEWAPISDLKFRAGFARATRAPNISELFGGAGQTFPTGLLDPCVGVTLTSTGTKSTNCRAAAGVVNNINANGGTFTLNQADLQGTSGFNLSNPNLSQETGDTFNVGVVITPRSIHALRNLQVTVDYYNIRVFNEIGAVSRQTVLNNCYVNSDPTACALITRRVNAEGPDSPGSLSFINSFPINQPGLGLQSKGIDATLAYRQPMADLGLGSGAVTARVSYTHLLKLIFPGDTTAAGEDGSARDRASGELNYDDSTVGVTLRGNFIGRSYLFTSFTGVAPGDPGSNPDFKIPAYFYMDAQVRFHIKGGFQFYVGVDNLFDKAPPPIISGLPGDNTGTETDAGTYDAIGRRFYAGVRINL